MNAQNSGRNGGKLLICSAFSGMIEASIENVRAAVLTTPDPLAATYQEVSDDESV